MDRRALGGGAERRLEPRVDVDVTSLRAHATQERRPVSTDKHVVDHEPTAVDTPNRLEHQR